MTRLFDVVLASAALALLTPLIAVVAVVSRLTSRQGVFFRQERVGLGGSSFIMVKFRTLDAAPDNDDVQREMIQNELAGTAVAVGGSFKPQIDGHATKVGAFLRRTSLDEVPQLINVLKGDMALVGPRPALRWEHDMFPSEYQRRCSVRPGITGLWQVSGRSRLSTLDMLKLDLRYVDERSFLGDLKILMRTIRVLLRGDGAR